MPPGGSWTVLQGYSGSSSATWSTNGLAAGTYALEAWARDASYGNTFDAYSYIVWITVSSGSPCTSAALSTSVIGTARFGLSAGSSGCLAPQYEFWVYSPAGVWSIVQSYGSSASATWNGSGLALGTYGFEVWARDASSSNVYDAYSYIHWLTLSNSLCASATLSASPTGTVSVGQSIQLSAASSGCPSPQYEFWLMPPGGSWTVLQSYSASATATWSTTGLAPGTYALEVWARDASSGSVYDAYSFIVEITLR
jgi:hypothetical protein